MHKVITDMLAGITVFAYGFCSYASIVLKWTVVSARALHDLH